MDEQAGRIDRLEMRVAHQDATIEELNVAITAQWRVIDGLKREMASLADRVHEFGRRDPSAPEPPPPHY